MNTSRFWVPADEVPYLQEVGICAFQGLKALPRDEFVESRELPAAQRRLMTPGFIQAFHWERSVPACPCDLDPSSPQAAGPDEGAVRATAG